MSYCNRFSLIIFIALISYNNSLGQTCLPTDYNKNLELSYERISVLPQILRFHCKLTLPCNQNLPTMNPLFIYDPLNGSAQLNWQIDSVRNVTKVSDPCLVFPKQPCYTVLFCHADVKAPSGAFGFTAFVEDCCLLPEYKNLFYLNNNSLIDDLPLSGSKTGCTPNFDGPVYNSIVNAIKIPQVTPDFINSSPIFKDEDTILNICVTDKLSYMVKATDPDGDSIAYHFSNPQNYLVKTVPVTSYAIVTKPPFSTLNYTGPIYSSGNPLGKGVSLNPVTGLVSGTIADTGSYLMTVSALEYRKGKVIDSISKNFVVHVFDCSRLPKPVASLPSLIN